MRHHDEDAAIGGGETVQAEWCAVRVHGVVFGGVVGGIDVAQAGFACGLHLREVVGVGIAGAAFTVADDDREDATCHAFE